MTHLEQGYFEGVWKNDRCKVLPCLTGTIGVIICVAIFVVDRITLCDPFGVRDGLIIFVTLLTLGHFAPSGNVDRD